MTSIRMLAGVALLAASFHAGAQEKPQPAPQAAEESAQRAEMRREVEEAARAIDAYSVSRRDEALQRAATAMEKMDMRIDRFQAAWAKQEQRISAESRASRDNALAEIRERRSELDARYRAMRESSTQAWTAAKERFIGAYLDLADSLRPARVQPESEEDSKSVEEAAETGSKKKGE
jgi:hypothetical protein